MMPLGLPKKFLMIILGLLVGCAAGRHALPDKAIIDVLDLREAIRIERYVDVRSDKLAPEGTPWFEVIEGPVPIIVTAPHSTKPFREGRYRSSDGGGTVVLAKMLNRLTGVTALYTAFSSPADPNYYDDNKFKIALRKLIRKDRPMLLLDVHGSHAYRSYDADLGTMDGKSLLGQEAIATSLISALQKEGLVNISYNFFGASQGQTITKFASALGVPAVQLEVSSTWLAPSQSDLSAHRFAQLLQALVLYIEAEKQKIPAILVNRDGQQAAQALP